MKKYLFILIAILTFESITAQNIHTGYHSNAFILKSSSNASSFPESNLVIGFPTLSNLNFGLQLPFSLNEALSKGADDSLRLDIPSIIDNLHDGEGLYMQARAQLFFLGIKLGNEKNIFAFVGDEIVTNFGAVVSGNLLDYLCRGNS